MALFSHHTMPLTDKQYVLTYYIKATPYHDVHHLESSSSRPIYRYDGAPTSPNIYTKRTNRPWIKYLHCRSLYMVTRSQTPAEMDMHHH